MLLALDTATTTASFALFDRQSKQILLEQTWQARRRQTEELLPAVEEAVVRLQRDRSEIDAVAVTSGPGSFTGVRIAISVAKGIALGLPHMPRLIGVPTLSVTAAPWLAPAGQASAQVMAFLQAGRGRYNWVLFQDEDRLRRPTAAEHGRGTLDDLDAALQAVAGPVWLVGEGTRAVEDLAQRSDQILWIEEAMGLRRAGHLAAVAAEHLLDGHGDGIDGLQPLYLSAPR